MTRWANASLKNGQGFQVLFIAGGRRSVHQRVLSPEGNPMNRLVIWVAGIVIALLPVATTHAAVPVQFTKIVDSQTPVPGGTGTFGSFSQAVLQGDRVAFVGRDSNVSTLGVYFHSPTAPLRVIANRTTTLPGSTRVFSFFRNPSIDGQNVAFNGDSNGSTFIGGTYARIGTSLIRIADTTSAGGGFFGFSNTALDGNRVSFSGNRTSDLSDAVYRGDGATLQKIAGSGTPVPGGTGTFSSVNSEIVARNDGLVFYGSGGGGRGVYKLLNGTLQKVADENTPIPVGDGNFTGFDNASVGFDGTNAAFMGFGSNSQVGVYAQAGNTLRRIADNGEIAPADGGRFRFPERYVSMDSGHVVFAANTNTSSAIRLYSDFDGSLRRIVGVNDILFGKQISTLSIDHQAISGNSIAFVANFTDGSSGVYLASIPEPSSLATCAALALALARSRRSSK
jgi:hypothetical protein